MVWQRASGAPEDISTTRRQERDIQVIKNVFFDIETSIKYEWPQHLRQQARICINHNNLLEAITRDEKPTKTQKVCVNSVNKPLYGRECLQFLRHIIICIINIQI